MRSHTRPLRSRAVLKDRLDRLVESFDLSTIAPDPLELVRRYDEPRDQEVVGLIAAAFAYGRAALVVAHVGSVLDRMTPSPFAYLRDGFDEIEASHRFAGFSHRFHKTPDLVALLRCLANTIQCDGSLGSLFRRVDRSEEPDIGRSLARFVEALLSTGHALERPSLRYLLSSPEHGSACKRMNLFLRWMVRREEPDLGLWSFVDPARLIMPLDTHVHRITTFLGLNGRATADWKTAKAVTETLRKLDPADPVRYDFAICRLGILDLCSRTPKKELCDRCLLNDVCRLRRRT